MGRVTISGDPGRYAAVGRLAEYGSVVWKVEDQRR
jgi:hypothetical protein